jgi:hypothetical protein
MPQAWFGPNTTTTPFACKQLGWRWDNVTELNSSVFLFEPSNEVDKWYEGEMCRPPFMMSMLPDLGELSDPQFAYKLGPGCDYKYLITCMHYHDHSLAPGGRIASPHLQAVYYVIPDSDAATVSTIRPGACLSLYRTKTGSIPANSWGSLNVTYKIEAPIHMQITGFMIHAHDKVRMFRMMIIKSTGGKAIIAELDIANGFTHKKTLTHKLPHLAEAT